MKPYLLVLAFVAAPLFAATTAAAPIPADSKNAGPAIIVQMKSFDQLLDVAKTSAKKFLAAPIYKEFETQVIKGLDPNFLAGIDTKRPAAFYTTIGEGLMTGDFSKSSAVALVPITNEKEFIATLVRLGFKPEQKGDIWTLPVPNSPIDSTLQFKKNYAYISLSTVKLDVKSLLDPAEVVNDKETAAFVVRLLIDRVPDELKKGGLEFLAQAAGMTKALEMPPEERDLLDDATRTGLRWLKTGAQATKELSFRLDLDDKTGAFTLETTMEPKSGSSLAKSFSTLKPTKNDFTGIIGADSTAHVLLQAPLFVEDFQRLLNSVINVKWKAIGSDIKEAPKEVQTFYFEVMATIDRTLKGGNLDFAASLRGPDANGQYTAVGAMTVKETAALEKAIKEALKFSPKYISDEVKVDVFQVGKVNVHEITVGAQMPAEAQKIFTKSSVYVAFAPDALFVTFGAHAKEVMKEVLTTKHGPKPAPLVQIEMSGRRMMPLLKSAGVPLDGPAGQFFTKFAQMDRIKLLSMTFEGGESLTIRHELGIMPFIGTMAVSGRRDVEAQPAPQIKLDKR